MSDHLYLKHSPLNHLHLENNARMTAFTGWSLPLHYGSIIAEHNYTRKAASIFDISHMGEFIIEGKTACEELNRLFLPGILKRCLITPAVTVFSLITMDLQ